MVGERLLDTLELPRRLVGRQLWMVGERLLDTLEEIWLQDYCKLWMVGERLLDTLPLALYTYTGRLWMVGERLLDTLGGPQSDEIAGLPKRSCHQKRPSWAGGDSAALRFFWR